jgi:phosphotransferase system HPr-like phosphotransfer protein
MGAALDVEAIGEDEQEATRAIEQIFVSGEHLGGR